MKQIYSDTQCFMDEPVLQNKTASLNMQAGRQAVCMCVCVWAPHTHSHSSAAIINNAAHTITQFFIYSLIPSQFTDVQLLFQFTQLC